MHIEIGTAADIEALKQADPSELIAQQCCNRGATHAIGFLMENTAARAGCGGCNKTRLTMAKMLSDLKVTTKRLEQIAGEMEIGYQIVDADGNYTGEPWKTEEAANEYIAKHGMTGAKVERVTASLEQEEEGQDDWKEWPDGPAKDLQLYMAAFEEGDIDKLVAIEKRTETIGLPPDRVVAALRERIEAEKDSMEVTIEQASKREMMNELMRALNNSKEPVIASVLTEQNVDDLLAVLRRRDTGHMLYREQKPETHEQTQRLARFENQLQTLKERAFR